MPESSTSGLNRALDTIGKCNSQANNYGELGSKVYQAVCSYKPEMHRVLDEKPCPSDDGPNAVNVAAWKKANNGLFSIIFFANSGSANNTARAHQGKTPGSLGDGAAA